MSPKSRRLRAGYTMIELLIVVVTLAVMSAMVAPRLSTIRESSTLRAGRQQLASAFSAAHAAALQKGRASALIINGDEVTVQVRSGLTNGYVRVYGPLRFDVSLGITLQRLDDAADTVAYNARGMLSNAVGVDQTLRYRLTSGTTSDTLCVSAAGLILPKGCTP